MRYEACLLAVTLAMAAGCDAQPAAARRAVDSVAPLGSTQAPDTAAGAIERVIAEAEDILNRRPDDTVAAIRLADAWLRQARVRTLASLPIKAERVLRPVLTREPNRADARRLLIATLLAQHRFAEALTEAERAAATRPSDAWAYVAIGDAHLELGDYEAAFHAFDRAMSLRPDASTYSRVAYARELTGDLPGALSAMALAIDATTPADVEQAAWHLVEIGRLHFAKRDLAAAGQAYARALHMFPDHPGARLGQARLAQARNDHRGALAVLGDLTPGADVWTLQAVSLRAVGRSPEATRAEALAEAAWRTDAPDPVKLALHLAGQPGRAAEAIRVAEAAWGSRRTIFIADALAWACFNAGRHEDARRMSGEAMRTGTADPEMRGRARAIAAAAARERGQ